MQLSELTKLLQTEYPLAENQEDLRYADEYALVEAEQQKLTSLHGEKPDYLVIIKNCVALLEQGAGHFMVLTALTHAMVQQYNWQGFVEGTHFLNDRLTRQWEGLYPSSLRMKGRLQPMNWLVERWGRYLETHPITGLGKDFCEKALQAILSLDETCQRFFADQVNLMAIIRPFQDQQKRMKLEEDARAANQKLEEERKIRESEETERQREQAALQNTLDINAEAVSTDEYLANMNAVELHILASKRLMKEQIELLKQNPLEFSIYKQHRAQMWWRYPISSQELFNLIDEQGLNWEAYSEALKLKILQNYTDALIAFEELAYQHPYFLNLQLHICDCLEELGAEEALLSMLKKECRELCERYPELEGAKINNEFTVCGKEVKKYFGLFSNQEQMNN